MSSIDPEILYLILTKVASKEAFYSLDGKTGSIDRKQLGEVYERITGSRVGSRVNWEPSLTQLNLLLSKCGLPALGLVLLPSDGHSPDSTAAGLTRVYATKWPRFAELKALYPKKR